MIAVGSIKLAVLEGAVLGHTGKFPAVGLHVPPTATAGSTHICVLIANARIIAVKALKIVRGLNIERKVLTGYGIFGYGIICVN
jgi:hypothetical protein